eukprot:COSAG02_NODE_870_length_16337_cov_45.593608_13_plen_494_part_00
MTMAKHCASTEKRVANIYHSLQQCVVKSTVAGEHSSGSRMAAISSDQLEVFARDGVLVLRGFFNKDELDAMAGPIADLQAEPDSPLVTSRGDVTKFNFPDFHGLRRKPSLAASSFDHPRVVGAVQHALGDDAELMQFGALTWSPDASGVSLHYDYKPFRVVGSSLDWLFCIVPLTDYEDHDGPLLVRPASHNLTTVLSNHDHDLLGAGRIHQVDAAQIPPFGSVQNQLRNPQLKRGDLLLMKGFTWHFADSSRPPSVGRTGLYMKFRAASSPPATGPLLFATDVAATLRHRQLMPHHRHDGTQTVDEGCLVLEQAGTNKIWAIPRAAGEWQLPRWQIAPNVAMSSVTTAAWDASNIIGDLQQAVLHDHNVQVSWMSWITDSKGVVAAGRVDAVPQERLCRVYGHLLDKEVEMSGSLRSPGAQFVDPEELAIGYERNWVRQWMLQVDCFDRPVKRGIGVAKDTTFSYGHEGKAWGKYRVGEFGEDGLPAPNSLA